MIIIFIQGWCLDIHTHTHTRTHARTHAHVHTRVVVIMSHICSRPDLPPEYDEMKGGDSDSEAMEVDSHTNGLGRLLVYNIVSSEPVFLLYCR